MHDFAEMVFNSARAGDYSWRVAGKPVTQALHGLGRAGLLNFESGRATLNDLGRRVRHQAAA
jgi:hypothetical protein